MIMWTRSAANTLLLTQRLQLHILIIPALEGEKLVMRPSFADSTVFDEVTVRESIRNVKKSNGRE